MAFRCFGPHAPVVFALSLLPYIGWMDFRAWQRFGASCLPPKSAGLSCPDPPQRAEQQPCAAPRQGWIVTRNRTLSAAPGGRRIRLR